MVGLRDAIESDFIGTISRFAPLVGTLLGSPVCGIALAALADHFGVGSHDLNAIAAAIKDDPNADIKLKEIEAGLQEKLAQDKSATYVAAVTDKQDARKYGFQYKDFLRHMAYFVTGGFFCTVFLMCLPLNISAAEKNILSMLVGMLASKWQTIIDFYYGSSRVQGDLK